MRLRDLHPYTRQAIALTHRSVDQSNFTAPTWDGTTLHIGRLEQEGHVLHEVAHWIVAPPPRRTMPNYGLGKDPDGGEATVPYPLASIQETARLVADAGLSTEGIEAYIDAGIAAGPKSPEFLFLHELAAARTGHEESLAAIVTIVLMRLAGIAWAAEMRRVFGKLAKRPDGFGVTTFWEGCAELVGERGVDLMDPLGPFRATGSAVA